MKKLSKHRRYVLAAGLLAVSAFAMAPGMLRGNASIAALLDRLQPQLQEPVTRLQAPRFNVLAPEPDYRLPAIAQDESAGGAPEDDEPLLADSGADPLAGAAAGMPGGEAMALAARFGGGFAAAGGAGGGGSARSTIRPAQTSAPRDAGDGPGSSAPADVGQGSGPLVPVDPPAAADLHDPAGQPGGDGHPGNGQPGQVVAVPEPSALSLIGVGIIGLVLCRRRVR